MKRFVILISALKTRKYKIDLINVTGNHTTAPMHKTAWYFPDRPSLSATTGISKLPGTQTTWYDSEVNNKVKMSSQVKAACQLAEVR